MTLGTFQPKARMSGDKLDLRQYAGRPLLVRTVDFDPAFSSPNYPEPKPVVFVDVVDLISGQIYISALWGAGAVVDNLKDKAGTEEVVAVKAANVPSTKRAGTHYVALFPLEAGELEAATGWYNQNWAIVDQTRAQRQAQAAPAQAPQPQYNQAPAAQPQSFQGQPNPQGQFAQPQYAPAQAPATQFGAPATQPSASPAYAPVAQGPAQGYTVGQPAPAPQQFGAPQAQAAPAPQYAPAQGFGAPQGGVFSDVPPGPPAGAAPQFAPPQGQDPAAAAAALNHLNQTVQQPQG